MTLGGSNTICLPPGASCPGGCRQNTLGHGLPLPGACERLPLGIVFTARLPLGLIPCHGSPVTPAILPGRCSTAPVPKTFPKQPGGLPVIIGCPNINVTLTQWPPSLPSPLVNLMDLLTPVPPRTATDFAACQPLESRVLKTVGKKKGEKCFSAYLAELSRVSRALASVLRIVCALQGPVTDLSLPPSPLKAVPAALTAAPALSLL